MDECAKHESYPAWIVLVTVLHSLAIYALGAYVLSGFGLIWAALYVVYCLALKLRLLKSGCPNCYYYGRACGLGAGWLSARLFGPGDPKRFAARQLTWADMVPEFLVGIAPLVGGIVLLVGGFDWLRLGLLLALVLLCGPGNAVVHGSLLCNGCKQHDLGCPACDFFTKDTREGV